MITNFANITLMSDHVGKIKKIFTPVRIIIFIIIIVLLGVAGYFFYQYQMTQGLLNNPEKATQVETDNIISAVGKIYNMPNETPTVATVSDKEKLSGQKFFESAENGDKVLLFEKNKKAILYRPSTNQIIEIGPINITENQEVAPSSDTQKSEPVSVDILNGTTVTALTSTGQKILEEDKSLNIEVGERLNASTRDYDKTIIVDVTGKNKSEADKIAKALNGSVAQLPKDEEYEGKAAIVVILGSDFADAQK